MQMPSQIGERDRDWDSNIYIMVFLETDAQKKR